jgi:hypothetical protein
MGIMANMVTKIHDRKVQLSVTVQPKLKLFVEEFASKHGVKISSIVSQCLEDFANKQKIALMEEGYKEMAEENRLLAEQFLPDVLETWPVSNADS